MGSTFVDDVPQKGEGWDSVKAILAGLDLDQRQISVAEDYDFDSPEEVTAYIRENLLYGDGDRGKVQDEIANLNWSKCPLCEEEIEEYMEEGAMRGEVDINSRYVVEHDRYVEDFDRSPEFDEKIRAWVAVYCDRHRTDEDGELLELFYYEAEWLE